MTTTGPSTATPTNRGARRRPFHAPSGPRQDDGLFTPTSVVWKVWTSGAMYAAAYRAVVTQMLLPPVAHGVDSYSDFSTDVMGRLRRTAHYFAAYAIGDTPTAEAVATQVYALHKRVRGTEPITGRAYEATDPELLLYVHVTGWHSALVCHERFAGPLTQQERDEYLAAGAVGTELSGFPGHLVPTTTEELRAYYARVRPQLAYGEHARNVIQWFAHPTMPPEWAALTPMVKLLRDVVATTLPRELQRMSGVRVVDERRAAAAVVAFRAAVHVLDDERLGAFQRLMMPEAYAIVRGAQRRRRAVLRARGEHPGPVQRLTTGARNLVAVP